LSHYLMSVTERIISDVVHRDTGDAVEREGSSALE
jgi:hypothetical protein